MLTRASVRECCLGGSKHQVHNTVVARANHFQHAIKQEREGGKQRPESLNRLT